MPRASGSPACWYRPWQGPGGDKCELISGHRRLAACKLLNLPTIPVIVRDLTDAEAVITMVDANLQRERLLPSEKAFAYKMKMEAMRKQSNRTDLTSRQVGAVDKVPYQKSKSKMLFKQGRAAEDGMGFGPLRPCLMPQFQPDLEGPPPDLAAFEAVLIPSNGTDPVAA